MRTSIKVILALFGSLATLAVLNMSTSSEAAPAMFLAENEEANNLLAFNNFLSEHNKNYITKQEYNARLQVFKSNLAYINSHNENNKDY